MSDLINVGQYVNDPSADDIRTAFQKVNTLAAGYWPFIVTPVTKTVTGALAVTDQLVAVDATAGNVTLTLVSPLLMTGRPVFIVRTDSTTNRAILSGTVNNGPSYVLSGAGVSILLISFGATYWVF